MPLFVIPAAVYIAIRYIIMAAIQLGMWTLLEKFGIPLINFAIKEIMQAFGVSEETATDIMANWVIVAFEEVGVFAITLRTKLPVKVAEKLGFTIKGWQKRKLPAAIEGKVPAMGKIASGAVKATAAETAKIGESVAMSRGLKTLTVVSVLAVVMSIVSATSNMVLAAANVMDFGNWQGAYQKTFQKIFTALGFPPDTPMPKSKAVSADMWSKIYTIVEELNPESIAFPWTGETKPYSRNNLADATDHFAANIALEGVKITWANVWGLLLPCIKLKNPATVGGVMPTVTTPTTQAVTLPQVRVFSGVVSQGVIGSTASFTPRQDDLIENAEELSQASHNNLAPFLAALPSRMSYEIKVVPSVKSANGFTQRGTAQRIISGYNKDGSPKYRTVVNKFATMDIFVRTDKGSQTKITTIVLGPVDSVRFQGANINLGAVAVGVQQNIIAPASVTTPTVALIPTTTAQPEVPTKESGQNVPYLIYKFTPNGNASFQALPATNTPYGASVADLGEARAWFALNPTALAQQQTILGFDSILAGQFVDSGLSWGMDKLSGEMGWGTWKAKEVAQVAPIKGPQATSATTLFDYYKAHGQPLPSVEERSKLYEQLALGQAAYYTGTAEQNTKLLAALQGTRL